MFLKIWLGINLVNSHQQEFFDNILEIGKNRLWNFNLHYFDYGIDFFEKNYALREKKFVFSILISIDDGYLLNTSYSSIKLFEFNISLI